MTIGKWSFCSCTTTSKCQVNKQIHESKEDFFKKNPNLVAINIQLKDLRAFFSNFITLEFTMTQISINNYIFN